MSLYISMSYDANEKRAYIGRPGTDTKLHSQNYTRRAYGREVSLSRVGGEVLGQGLGFVDQVEGAGHVLLMQGFLGLG